MAKIYGAILAGGQGSRLGGRNKAHLVVGDAALLERARSALAEAAEAVAVAGGDRVTEAGGMPCLADPVPGVGPLAGLAAGLAWAEAAGADWLLTAPVDAPFLRPTVYRQLLEAADSASIEGSDAVIADVDGRVQWLAAAWRPRLAPAARAACVGDDRSIARFASGIRHSLLALEGVSAMFLNVNTPADLAAAHAQAALEKD